MSQRINVEAKFWSDIRREMLAMKIGDSEAIGQCLKLWRVAQTYWVRGELIPESAFQYFGLSESLFDVDLAVRRDGGIYARGSKDYFAWLIQKSEAGKKGGIESGKARSNKINDLTEAATKRDEAEGKRERSGAKPPTPTPTPTLYSSSSEIITSSENLTRSSSVPEADANALPSEPTELFPSSELKKQEALRRPKPAPSHDQELCRRIWDSYSTAYQTRYGKEPLRNAKTNSQIVQLSKRLGADAIDVVKFFVRSEKQFYRTVFHVLDPCVKDAEALHTQWVTGVKAPELGQFKTAAEKKADYNRRLVARLRQLEGGGSNGDA